MDGWRIDRSWTEADLDAVHAFLGGSYWAEGIPRATVERAMRGSYNFVLRPAGEAALQGYARVISDGATFAYLCDVFIAPALRGRGLGDWLIGQVVAAPELQGLRRFSLFTRDAHALYARHGFKPLATPDRGMEIVRPGLYLQSPSP